jgi:hypothetical protein
MGAFRPPSANASSHRRIVPSSDKSTVATSGLHQAQYSEKIVYLLNSYQPKDNKRQSRASKAPRPAYSIDDAKDIVDVFENAV